MPVGYGAAAKAVHHAGQDIPEDGFVYAVELFGLFFRIEFAEPAVAFVVGFPCYVYFVVAHQRTSDGWLRSRRTLSSASARMSA